MITPKYEAALVKAFNDLHHCVARYIKTESVMAQFEDGTVWVGEVEVFHLNDHPRATRGYAWAFDRAKGNEVEALLELPPVISPITAVQAALARKTRNRIATESRPSVAIDNN